MSPEAAIPEDILIAAEKALDLLLCNCREAGDVRQDSIEDIARAIMAERVRATAAENERCVRVIEGLEWFIELSPDHVRGRKPEEYASAIRSHPKKLPAGDAAHANTSPGPVNCSTRLRHQGQVYPRTCGRCGLGPCPFFREDGSAK